MGISGVLTAPILQAWAEMHREGLEANAAAWTNQSFLCSKFRGLKAAFLSPVYEVTYGCMLDACVKCGHLDKAVILCHHVSMQTIVSPMVSFCAGAYVSFLFVIATGREK